MHGAGHVWGVCVTGSVHGRGACVVGETATTVNGTHPSGMHSCLKISSRQEMGVELAITSLLSNGVLILAKSSKSK